MPYCPKCGYEYRPEIETCPDCDVPLVDESPEAKPEPKLVMIRRYRHDIEAQQARIRLEAHGIRSFVQNEPVARTISLMLAEGVMLMVSSNDARDALRILESDT